MNLVLPVPRSFQHGRRRVYLRTEKAVRSSDGTGGSLPDAEDYNRSRCEALPRRLDPNTDSCWIGGTFNRLARLYSRRARTLVKVSEVHFPAPGIALVEITKNK